ncbi:MAG: LL-diaminopimelate aminotransferase, partial [Candidatus Micrarchaeota archaeon]|nr:LL-diaminopimelate aminotransferase [Candidatus Micrarchaeota archaeon]
MARINEHYRKFESGYFFTTASRKAQKFAQHNPGVKVHKLGIGDTTEPLAPSVIEGLHAGVYKLARVDTYTGYGEEQGNERLRQAIIGLYSRRKVSLSLQDVFISDGAKPDTANIQSIFSKNSKVAVQDPTYPVYLESNVVAGRTGRFLCGGYAGVVYMPCNENNGF